MVDDVRWIESAGGPLAVLPTSNARFWRGIATDDYADACEIESCSGVLERPWGGVLVLNDEPLRTAVISSEEGCAILRWMYAPGAKALIQAAAKLDVDSKEPV